MRSSGVRLSALRVVAPSMSGEYVLRPYSQVNVIFLCLLRPKISIVHCHVTCACKCMRWQLCLAKGAVGTLCSSHGNIRSTPLHTTTKRVFTNMTPACPTRLDVGPASTGSRYYPSWERAMGHGMQGVCKCLSLHLTRIKSALNLTYSLLSCTTTGI